MASVLGNASTITTSCTFRNEPQLCTKFSGSSFSSTLWLSCIGLHGNKSRKHFQIRSSNGHPLNAVSSHDGVYVLSSIYIILFLEMIVFYVVVEIVKLNFILLLDLAILYRQMLVVNFSEGRIWGFL